MEVAEAELHTITQDDIDLCDARTTRIVSRKFGSARDEDELQIGRLAMCEAAKNHDESKSRFYHWAGLYIMSYLYHNEYGYHPNGSRKYSEIYSNKTRPASFDAPNYPQIASENLESLIIKKDKIEKKLRTMPPSVAKAIIDKEISGIPHDQTGVKLGYGKRSLSSLVDQWKHNRPNSRLSEKSQRKHWSDHVINVIDIINADIDYEYIGGVDDWA